jgi:hypothetical protein
MSLLYYRGIQLQVCRFLTGCERAPIYDGPTYLYTRWRIHCQCLYNPQGTSYDFPVVADRPGPGGPIVSPMLPPQTDQAIRHRLMARRGQLVLGVGNNAWLVSPQQGFTVDSANGPTPLYCNVRKGPGGRSFIVEYGIETCLRECNLESSTYPSIFLSHRWEMEHRLDDDFFTTRIIRGHVIFDTARLQQGGTALGQQVLIPDQYRGAFFHPIPMNCQRSIPVIRQHADGNSVEYVIEDEEQSVNLGFDLTEVGVTQIECSHTANLGVPSEFAHRRALGQTAMSVILGVVGGVGAAQSAQRAIDEARAQRGQRPTSRFQRGLHYGAAAAAGLATGGLAGIGAVVGVTPMMTHTIAVRVGGDGTSSKAALTDVAQRIIALRLAGIVQAGIFGDFGHFGNESAISWDMKGRVVEVTYMQITALLGFTNLIINDIPEIHYPAFNFADRVPGLLEPGDGTTNALPPGDFLTRGTMLEMIVAQGLQDPCTPIYSPTPPPFISGLAAPNTGIPNLGPGPWPNQTQPV